MRATAIASPLTPTPLPRGERGYSHEPINSVPSPLEGERQGEGGDADRIWNVLDRAMTTLPIHARAIIIGGGIIGCSTAYHLAKLGWRDVVLLERHKLTSGSTWHAAGLVGQLRTSANITQLLKYSVELYAKLEQETGQATGWKMNGGLRLACNAERLTEIKRQATTAHSFGLEMHILTAEEARKLWPPMAIEDVVGAAFLPTDGQANPADIAQALAKGARAAGVCIIEDCRVTVIKVRDGR